jgi:hypothetical protein
MNRRGKRIEVCRLVSLSVGMRDMPRTVNVRFVFY